MYTYPLILQNPQLGVDKFQWQTVIDESSSRCQFPSQTEVKIQFTIISKFLQLLSIFFYLSFVDVRLRDAKKHKIEWNFAVEKSPTRIESIIKISTCISLLILTQDSPSRTTWPVWSSSGNACISCSSPSHPHPFLAYHTTSAVEKKITVVNYISDFSFYMPYIQIIYQISLSHCISTTCTQNIFYIRDK